jgi:hypothetical protein
LRIDPEGGPQRSARIAGRWLHPHILERALRPQARIEHAIQRHSAGQAQRLFPCRFMQPGDEFQRSFFHYLLE